ncbi:MAG TPA: hypothetical protein VM778_05180 [Gemmatimonadota bacterium]|nr:hypothetical protein [Gemmatimonadota bacterium]
MRMLLSLPLAVSLCAFAAAPVQAQSYRQILQAQIDAVDGSLRDRGYRPDPGAFPSDFIAGFLEEGASVGLELTLQAGQAYVVVGVCDADCSDLDLAVLDDSGNVLVEDELTDDVPVLEFNGPPSGVAMLLVTMYDCSVEPCGFAYKVYRR